MILAEFRLIIYDNGREILTQVKPDLKPGELKKIRELEKRLEVIVKTPKQLELPT